MKKNTSSTPESYVTLDSFQGIVNSGLFMADKKQIWISSQHKLFTIRYFCVTPLTEIFQCDDLSLYWHPYVPLSCVVKLLTMILRVTILL